MLNILFVCLGNICRSPLAEAVFDHLVKNQGLEKKINSDSCGTAGYHIGADPDHRSQHIAKVHNVPMEHSARKFSKEDYQKFDYIIPMDEQNYKDIISIAGSKHDGLMLMRKFDPDANGDMEVPDPYYGGADGFSKVYDMLERSNLKFIEFLKDKHGI